MPRDLVPWVCAGDRVTVLKAAALWRPARPFAAFTAETAPADPDSGPPSRAWSRQETGRRA
ncbi:hypothetical protein, partial [Streptomyces sp. NPDC050804]|uniref:hypothetical protein n=1 Tax=Streptomyces sp. NPDC050804 TaxID=3154745 RepID=UPI00341618C4